MMGDDTPVEFVDELPEVESPWFPWMRQVHDDPDRRWAKFPLKWAMHVDGYPFPREHPDGVHLEWEVVGAPGLQYELFGRRTDPPEQRTDPPAPRRRVWRHSI